MKKKISTDLKPDDLRPEYDFSKMKMVGRGLYAKRYRSGTNIVRISPDLAKVFPDEKAVNDGLRLLIKLSEVSVQGKRRKAM